jgi:hypothetical protein
MATRDDQRRLIKLARLGKLEGDDGFRVKLAELVKSGFVGDDLDYNEKPYFRSALWEASWKNYETIVKLLVDKKANLQFPDFQKRTPLHEAAFYGHTNLVQYLLDNGHPIDPKDDFGQTPLFRAVDANRTDVIDILVKRKADTNLLDSDSCTIQHLAGFQGLQNNAQWMMYRGSWRNRYSIEEPGPVKPAKHEFEFGTWPSPREPAKEEQPNPALPDAAATSEVFVTEKDSPTKPPPP